MDPQSRLPVDFEFIFSGAGQRKKDKKELSTECREDRKGKDR